MPIPPSLHGPLRLTTRVPPRYMEGGRGETGYPTITLNDHAANANADFPSNTLYTTKYTLWSFIPKVLYEQFRKATSFYFLFIAILVSIPAVSPINPLTSWLGLIFILGVAAIREAYEDILRTIADNKVNSLKFTKIDPSTGLEKQICSHEIQVGDILLCRNNNRIPSDLILLKTSFPDGTGFIETAQLDGETNLKIRYSANPYTYEMTQGDLCRMSGSVQADVPNSNLYSFKGSLRVDGAPNAFSLDEKNLCLSGSILRNTDFIIGVVVYAGVETKLGLNLKLPPSKFSSLDEKLNKYILLIFCIKILLVIIMTVNNVVFEQSDKAISQDLLGNLNAPTRGVIAFTTYFALLNSLIPLSMVVTLEIVRFVQAAFMEWDETFFHEDKEATATTSNLNDQLALVDYIFSDKTGTLTENIMTFKKASLNGAVIDDSNNEGRLLQMIENPIDKTSKQAAALYLKVLVLAHSCQPDEVNGKIVYKSASPDEEALCNAARQNGYVFVGRKGPNIILNVRGREKVYQLLTEIEFSSERRRMSMIVRTPKNKIILLSKGADVEMQGRIAGDQQNQQKLDITNKDLYLFSTQGLRTLILGYKVLTPDDYERFRNDYNVASNMIDNREVEVARVCDAMERNLQLIGATAIEDKLQNGVPKTIHNLRRAGIKIWLITGDKDETAVNIGFSSNLISQDMGIEFLTGKSSQEVLTKLRAAKAKYLNTGVKKKQFAFIVNGESLGYIIRDFSTEFVEVAQHCASIICARVTPLQKAEVVKMVQDAQPDACCLAIGDGGNDVSMIQQAQIGIGIKGREGGQAARASDFSIPQFRHLQRLLFIHGRYSLLRNTKVIYMSFYKNITVFICNAYFGIFNGGSGQTIFDDWLVVFFNIVFTSLPLLAVGLFERDLHESIIDRNPPIYRSQKKLYFLGLLEWIGFAIYHSLVLFGSGFLIFRTDISASGQSQGFEYFGLFLMTIGLFVVLLKFLLETFDWSVATAFGHGTSIFCFILAVTIENYSVRNQLYVASQLFNSGTFWASFFIIPVLCLLPDFTLKYFNRQTNPKAWHILQEKYSIRKSEERGRRYSTGTLDEKSNRLIDLDVLEQNI